MQDTATPTKHLQHLLSRAIDAYRGTSFSPEERGRQLISGYEQILADDLHLIEGASEPIKEQYKQRFIKYLNAYLSAKSRIVSTMISGTSNFPHRRMQKYNDWEHSAYQKFHEFRQKAVAGISKQVERDRPQEEKDSEAWQSIKRHIESSAATIVNIDEGIERGYSRALFVSSITGLIKRMAANGQTEHVKKAIELINSINANNKKPVITKGNSIFKLVETAQAAAEAKEDKSKRENQVFLFPGGEVVVNWEIDRIQIVHDSKPAEDVRQRLKKLGFNWSPFHKAWQRKITQAAVYNTNQFTGLNLKG